MIADQPHAGAHPRHAGEIDDRVGEPRPEEKLRPQRGHGIGFARDHRRQDQRGEQDQALEQC